MIDTSLKHQFIDLLEKQGGTVGNARLPRNARLGTKGHTRRSRRLFWSKASSPQATEEASY